MIVDAFLFIGKLLETCGLIGGLSMEIKLLLGEINADRSCLSAFISIVLFAKIEYFI